MSADIEILKFLYFISNNKQLVSDLSKMCFTVYRRPARMTKSDKSDILRRIFKWPGPVLIRKLALRLSWTKSILREDCTDSPARRQSHSVLAFSRKL